jgi:hypothetical protein
MGTGDITLLYRALGVAAVLATAVVAVAALVTAIVCTRRSECRLAAWLLFLAHGAVFVCVTLFRVIDCLANAIVGRFGSSAFQWSLVVLGVALLATQVVVVVALLLFRPSGPRGRRRDPA